MVANGSAARGKVLAQVMPGADSDAEELADLVMRRAAGENRYIDRGAYLSRIRPGRRETHNVEVVHQSAQCAVVTCVVRVFQPDESGAAAGEVIEKWAAFSNVRVFTRPTCSRIGNCSLARTNRSPRRSIYQPHRRPRSVWGDRTQRIEGHRDA